MNGIRHVLLLLPLLAMFLLVPGVTGGEISAQTEQSRPVENGGIHVPGWMGSIDASEASRGMSVDDASLTMTNRTLYVTTGPAVTYWNPSDTASGDYTVEATFTEPHYMNRNDHPHPYGIVVAGQDMGTSQERYLYCAAYGDGRFIVRGFGPEPFQMNGPNGESNEAIHRAEAVGQPVTQMIAVSVQADQVSCAINGTVVASYPRSEIVGSGKLQSTNGVYGIRFGHNTEGSVSGLRMTGNQR